MTETPHPGHEAIQHLTAADLIVDIDVESAVMLDALIDAASCETAMRHMWPAVEAVAKSPTAVRMYMYKNRKTISEDELKIYAAVLRLDSLIDRITDHMHTRTSLLSRLSTTTTDALDTFNPSFSRYRSRVYTCRQREYLDKQDYQPYMNHALVVGMAFFAARTSKPPAV
jgi:hypothetical protein